LPEDMSFTLPKLKVLFVKFNNISSIPAVLPSSLVYFDLGYQSVYDIVGLQVSEQLLCPRIENATNGRLCCSADNLWCEECLCSNPNCPRLGV